MSYQKMTPDEFRKFVYGTKKLKNITDKEKAELNITLAANDLYEACIAVEPFLRALRDHLKENEPNHDGSLYEDGALTKLQAAIKKAEGR